jgi:hypothetical protein
MTDPATLETLRAAVETVAPATEGMPGATDVNSHEHVAEMLDIGLPGITVMIAALFDAYAADVKADTPFKDLSIEDRGRVVRAMSTDDSQDIRDAIDAIIVFGCGGLFSEWSGYDRASRALKAPATWAALGFHGPVHGHPNYREDA